MTHGYRRSSWINPLIEIRRSSFGGKGSFARKCINSGTLMTIWGGTLFTSSDIGCGKAEKSSLVAVGEDLFLGQPSSRSSTSHDLDHLLNHSSDPNLWLADEVTLVARRNISFDEELTADYATWEADEDFTARWDCMCGSPLCRRRITGRDWRRTDIQARYQGHFSPFLEDRIRSQKSAT